MNKIELGDKVKDEITGFTGIAIAITEWLYGCRRVVVKPDRLDKEGKILESTEFDEPQLKVVKAKKIKKEKNDVGGWKPSIHQKSINLK